MTKDRKTDEDAPEQLSDEDLKDVAGAGKFAMRGVNNDTLNALKMRNFKAGLGNDTLIGGSKQLTVDAKIGSFDKLKR